MPALALLVLLLLQGAAPDAPARRELLRAFLGARAASDLEREAELGAEIEAARAGAGEPWSALLERALAWSAADVAALRATETRLRELRHAAQLPDAAALEALRREAEASGADALFTAEWGALGHHLGELERSDEAVALVTWVGERAEHWGDLDDRSWSLEWRGQELWRGGELQRAAELLGQAASVDRERGNAVDGARHLADVARIRLTQGELERALQATEEAEAIARAAASPQALRIATEVRGGLLLELGRHREAIELCLELAPPGTDALPRDETQVRLDLLASNALADVGRLESAETYARRAHELALDPAVIRRAPLLQLETRLALGLLLADLGRTNEGLALLDEAAAEFTRLEDARGLAWAEKNRGFVLFASARYREAVAAFERAEATGRELGVPYLEGLAALGRAEALARLSPGSDPDARAHIDAALRVAEECAARLAERQIQWRCAALRGRLLLDDGRPAEALVELERAVLGIERWRRRLGAPGLVEHALRSRSDPYRDAVFAAARLGRVEDAVRFAERLHGRLLAGLRARRSGFTEPADSPAVVEARDRLGELEFRLRQSSGPAAESSGTLEAAEGVLDAALLAAELARGDDGAPPPGKLTVDDVRRTLPSKGIDTALVYVVGERATLVLRIDADGAKRGDALTFLDVGRERLADTLARLAPFEDLEAGRVDLAHLGFDWRAARDLHEWLVAPFQLAAETRLAIVADGGLTAVPFELFVSGGEPGALDTDVPFAHLATLEFLGDTHAIAYYGSLADLARPAGAQRPGETRILVAPPEVGVRGAEKETRAIVLALGDRAVRVVERATPADVVAEAAGAATLHFVAHGRVDPAAPAHGHLVLGARGSDVRAARFEAWEAESLALDGALVVLSGCHTGGGSWYAGAGLSGLTRGFLLAGAREVVASQWAVEDRATARFMELFYRVLATGRPVPEALRDARFALRHERDPRGFALAHPYFWAAWIVRR